MYFLKKYTLFCYTIISCAGEFYTETSVGEGVGLIVGLTILESGD